MINLSTDQKESIEYLFKTNNYHVNNFKEVLRELYEYQIELVLSSDPDGNTKERLIGSAKNTNEILQLISFD